MKPLPPTWDEQKSIMDLIQRSKDIGNGWRQVSDGLWNFVKTQAAKWPAHFELDESQKRIRFSPYE